MQDPRMLSPEESLVPKSRKKKPSKQKVSMFPAPGHNVKELQELRGLPFQMEQKPSKRGLVNVNDVSTVFQQPDKSTLGSFPDSSLSSGNDYRALRRKYLLLEERSFGLGKELKDVDDQIKALEEEKLALLDELVVLEGLVDPSEKPSQASD